jgi:hypothetical protein
MLQQARIATHKSGFQPLERRLPLVETRAGECEVGRVLL